MMWDFKVATKMNYQEKRQRVNSLPFLLLAPQPGLEPGTYGLTESQVVEKFN
jgi:hypothetical protein